MTEFVPALAEDEAGLPGPRIGEPIAAGRQQPFKSLRHREFRLLFSAYAIGDLGFWISHISLQYEMSRITKGSFWLGFLFFATFIPALVFAPAAGVIADRFDRKLILVVSRVLVACVAAILSVLLHADVESPEMLATFGFLIGTLFAFMGPAQQAITANAVPGEDLASAISLQAAGNNVLRVGGPALATPILAGWGAAWAFAVYAATNVLMVLVLTTIRVSRRRDEPSHSGMWQQWTDGLRHARERRPALTALTTMAVLSMFGVSYVALVPVFTVEVLHHPRRAFTTLVVAQGVGAVLGALAIGFRRRPLTIVTAEWWLFLFSLSLCGFSLARSWALALVLNAIVGFCYFSATTTINTLVQQLADDDKRGRVMSLFNLAWAGFVPLGGIWMGTVADAGGAPMTVQIGAGVCFVFSVSALARYSTAPPR